MMRGGFQLNILGTVTQQVVSLLINLLSMVLIARLLGPQCNGEYALALFFPMFLTNILSLGIPSANIYYINKDKENPSVVFKTTAYVWLYVSIFGLIVSSVIIYFIFEKIFPEVEKIYFWLSLVIFPVSLLNGFILSIFQALQRFSVYNSVLLIQPILNLLLLVVFLYMVNQGVRGAILSWIISYTITVVVSLYYILKEVSFKKEKASISYFYKATKYGYKVHLCNILAFINEKVDTVLIGILVGPAATGLYVIAAQITQRLWVLSTACSTVLFPKAVESHQKNTKFTLTPVISRWVMLLTIVGAVGVYFLADIAISILFGEEYKKAVLSIYILLPGIVCGAVSRVLANDISAQGYPELNLYNDVFAVLINLICNILLIPIYGIDGAAAATSISYFFNVSVRLYIYSKLTKVNILEPVCFSSNDFDFIKTLINKIMYRVRKN
ncbi:flippase [Spartinivicinus ruber]|uniref:flippase n=1 Tax=Spartinivicinus ruber TaxID=2683272 RepID=UPI0013D7ED04|nr:flippase [Spartinivicinus ruber]